MFLEAMFRIYVLIELCKTYFTCFNLTIIIINIAIQAPNQLIYHVRGRNRPLRWLSNKNIIINK